MSVDSDRLRDLTLELVEVESPTGDTAEVARLYARRLEEIGLEVELLDERFPATPIVIGRLRGGEPGPTVVLNGHLDTVPIPHEPARVDGSTIYGRGTADMKGALACAAEAARVVAERGSFPGELVIVAIGMHEAPGGRGEDLTYLLGEHGFTADLGVVCELGGPTLPVAHPGCATFAITIRREGMVTHELQTAAGTPNPVVVAASVIEAIRARTEELAAVEHEWVGPETYFLGEVHGGDFYNRYPVGCRLVGTRRWSPGNTLRAGGGGVRGAAGPDRGGVRLRDRPRPAARARGVRDRSGAQARGRAARGVPRRHGAGAAADRREARRRRRDVQRRGDPDRLPRPDGDGRARGRRVDRGGGARAGDAGLSRAAGASLGLSYEQLYEGFRWQVPAKVNLGVDVCERHPRDAVAIVVTDGREVTRRVTFGELSDDSNRLANALRARGVGQGDRVGIALPQRPETAVAHIAVYKLGAIAVPLSTRFGPDAMAVRLGDADPAVVLADRELEGVETIDVERELPALLAAASDRFEPVATAADAPALIVYTSGTTGPPKGALLAHRVLYGHLPGFELSHDFFPQPDDLIWSPADWAWMGGLFDVLMPGLYHGRPVLAFQTTKFDPELTFDLIPRLGVRNVFMPATALRMMAAHDGPALSLRTLASGGEMVGEETAAWCSERLGARLNEFYGQTEANLLIGNCEAWPAKPGSMGRAYPGHELRLVDGEVAVRVEGDPVVFLGYWRNEAATAEKVRDGWLHTGDLAEVDDEGYYRFVGRTDDLISSAGHRIGPGEIEECLVRHPSVTLAAVIGIPDEVRGEAIKAFVVAESPSEALAAELKALVRERLAAYEVPREIEFVDELPLTTSGKIRRNELRRLERMRRL